MAYTPAKFDVDGIIISAFYITGFELVFLAPKAIRIDHYPMRNNINKPYLYLTTFSPYYLLTVK